MDARSSSPELGDASPVLGRGPEIGRVRHALSEAAAGRGSALVVRGEPGMGKTTVLRSGVEGAPEGMRIVWAGGVEAEAEIDYATLTDVLRPAVDSLDALVPTQRTALESALALGPPSPADALAIGSAALSLLVAAAAAGPLGVLVDDLQFVDAASQFVLAFVGRRLRRENVALVTGVRAEVPTPFDGSGVEEVELGPLDEESARRIVTATVPGIADSARNRIVQTALGNPLALVELPTLLDAEQIAGHRPLDDPLRVNGTVHAAFAHRLSKLSPEARRALLVVAADETADLDVVRSAVAALGVDDRALDEAEREGALALGPPLRIRHPLLRSLIYHQAGPAEQRAAHAALADGLRDDPYRKAWHRGLAASAPDETVAAELDEAAALARVRSLFSSAAAASERAAALSPSPESRARRLVAAAASHQLAGSGEAAASRTAEALELTTAPDVRAAAVRLQVNALLFGGNPRKAFALLTSTAAAIEANSPADATVLLVQAVLASEVSSEIDRAVQTGRRAVEIAERAGPRERFAADLALAEALLLSGDAAAVRDLQARARSVAPVDDPLSISQLLQSEAAHLMILGEHESALTVVSEVVAGARNAGMPTVLPYPLAVMAEIGYRTGRWTDALSSASEAVELAEQSGQGLWETYALQVLARIEAARGDDAAANAHLDRADALGEALGLDVARFFNPATRAFAALTGGRYADAVSAAREVETISAERGLREPAVVLWAPDLIEAYLRVDRLEDARRLLARFEGEAASTGRIWANATAARCHGLLEEDFEDCFATALAWHDRIVMPFERARTELLLGKRRRRSGRRTAARAPLASALETFERLGAVPWAERAQAELRATGARTGQRDTPPTGELTPHEVRVALIIARGATTREAAAELLVSPKTVDYHLQRVYRKLGISTRAQLARLFPEQ
jgi:DNA-binding CsgD family transcriptional regulator